jgi:hypothetical protein
MSLGLTSDLLVFPIVIINALIIKASLTGINRNNGVIFITLFFLLTHLCLTTLSYFQLRDLEDTYVTRIESAAFNAVLSALLAAFTYMLIGAIPIFKAPFFMLGWLPYSNVWKDLVIVALPAYIAHYTGKHVITDLLGDD